MRVLLLCLLALTPAFAYDPLEATPAPVKTLDLTITDASRDRDLPIRAYLPPGAGLAPVVLFSHGLGGSRAADKYLGEHWARRGYLAIFVQHPGSDESLWRDEPVGQRMAALQTGATLENYVARVKDIPAVLDGLARGPLKERADLTRVGMSGHSFGAQTTQAQGGQNFMGRTFGDPRIDAALAMSPSTPRRGNPKQAFATVKLPWMLMTGTKDIGRIGGADLESRLGVYPALPAGDKYELVLEGAEHSAFSDRSLPGEGRNPNHHRVILALSTAFWDAYLKGDPAAKAWLKSEAPRRLMEPKDRWQTK
ncbi:MAG: alpha/beta hydrolase family protein [Vulcanimicrobiota bacterium]